MPSQPPLDTSGNVVPHDHPEIEADHGVIRRISDRQIVPDGNGGRRISSIAFKASSGPNDGMSVDLEAFIVADGRDAMAFVTTPRWIGSVRFVASGLRSLGFMVGFDPIKKSATSEANPFHGQVWGNFNQDNIDEMRSQATWFVPISGVLIK